MKKLLFERKIYLATETIDKTYGQVSQWFLAKSSERIGETSETVMSVTSPNG